jgi:hypothetical protein
MTILISPALSARMKRHFMFRLKDFSLDLRDCRARYCSPKLPQ